MTVFEWKQIHVHTLGSESKHNYTRELSGSLIFLVGPKMSEASSKHVQHFRLELAVQQGVKCPFPPLDRIHLSQFTKTIASIYFP